MTSSTNLGKHQQLYDEIMQAIEEERKNDAKELIQTINELKKEIKECQNFKKTIAKSNSKLTIKNDKNRNR